MDSRGRDPGGPRPDGQNSRAADRAARLWPPLAVAALLAAAALAAALSSPGISRIPLPAERETPGAGSGSPSAPSASAGAAAPHIPPPYDLNIPGWFSTGLAVLCGAAVVAVAGVLLWYVVRDTIQVRGRRISVEPGTPQPPAAHQEKVVAAVDAGLAELADTDADPRRAVIACWVRLERAAADAGTPRGRGDTPADLVHRLLAAHAVTRPVLDRFAAVYREARYATHVIDERMRETAVTSLRQLRDELAGVPR
jgi:hypothetical protein